MSVQIHLGFKCGYTLCSSWLRHCICSLTTRLMFKIPQLHSLHKPKWLFLACFPLFIGAKTTNTVSKNKMHCQVYLRFDQSLNLREKYTSDKVTIFAPLWAKQGLDILGSRLKGTVFDLVDEKWNPGSDKPVCPAESFTITENFNDHSLGRLQQAARNEPHNTSGVVNISLYPGIDDQLVIYALRDLVRQCVIVGVDESANCGGYRCRREKQDKKRVYVVDLAALQFQEPYNTGRLVLVQKQDIYKSPLDDLIFENVVGEKKRPFHEVSAVMENNVTEGNEKQAEMRKRYVLHKGFSRRAGRKSCYLDTKAYAAFVRKDVVLSGLAVIDMVKSHYPEDQVVFKFLKYGTGFFAGDFADELDGRILTAVLDGLEKLFEKAEGQDVIKVVELPFYELKSDAEAEKNIESIKEKYGVEVVCSHHDALKQTSPDLLIATTNCGDNHAVCGNEMGFSSVDAAIAENLESKGHIFSPSINLGMGEKFMNV